MGRFKVPAPVKLDDVLDEDILYLYQTYGPYRHHHAMPEGPCLNAQAYLWVECVTLLDGFITEIHEEEHEVQRRQIDAQRKKHISKGR